MPIFSLIWVDLHFTQDETVDIFGPEFQPYVHLVRLSPEEILSLSKRSGVNKEVRNNNKVMNQIFLYIQMLVNLIFKKNIF